MTSCPFADKFDAAMQSGQMGGSSPPFTALASGETPDHAVLRLTRFEHDAAEPPLITVSLWYDTLTNGRAADIGALSVYARLRWVTGKGYAEAEADIPAGGTCFTVAGGDGLIVNARAVGGSREQIVVRGTASISRSGHPRAAYRTVPIALPAQSTVNFPIPPFARSVRMIALDPLTAINVRFRQVNGALRFNETYFGDDPSPIVPGSHEFENIGAAAQTIFNVFELQF